mmetsp:Transcript_15216/g.36229  ORF Transcript_15216/g.36229 Transcript_15216/m.36229 type:complete len:276 (+) Transcript_15216:1739-2566(+)
MVVLPLRLVSLVACLEQHQDLETHFRPSLQWEARLLLNNRVCTVLALLGSHNRPLQLLEMSPPTPPLWHPARLRAQAMTAIITATTTPQQHQASLQVCQESRTEILPSSTDNNQTCTNTKGNLVTTMVMVSSVGSKEGLDIHPPWATIAAMATGHTTRTKEETTKVRVVTKRIMVNTVVEATTTTTRINTKINTILNKLMVASLTVAWVILVIFLAMTMASQAICPIITCSNSSSNNKPRLKLGASKMMINTKGKRVAAVSVVGTSSFSRDLLLI